MSKRTRIAAIAGAAAAGTIAVVAMLTPSPCSKANGSQPCLLDARMLPDGGERMPRALATGEIAPAAEVFGTGCEPAECPP